MAWRRNPPMEGRPSTGDLGREATSHCNRGVAWRREAQCRTATAAWLGAANHGDVNVAAALERAAGIWDDVCVFGKGDVRYGWDEFGVLCVRVDANGRVTGRVCVGLWFGDQWATDGACVRRAVVWGLTGALWPAGSTGSGRTSTRRARRTRACGRRTPPTAKVPHMHKHARAAHTPPPSARACG